MFLQVLFILPHFHDRQQHNDKSTAFDTNMNIERFHNELAMRLGYERIVKDKRISISVEESAEPCVILTLQSGEVIRIKASDKQDGTKLQTHPAMQNEFREVYEAVHQAYKESIRSLLNFVI